MPVFDITAPDGTKYEVTGPEGSTEHDALAQVMAQHQQSAAKGQQPSFVDRAIASPVGRFVQDNIISPVEGIASGAARVIGGPTPANNPSAAMLMSPVQTLLNRGIAAEQGGYNAALARNRNTPGYAAARSKVDSAMPSSGIKDQLLPQLQPTLAGLPGFLTGDLDTSNAMADAQTDNQNAFHAAHPILSTAANIAGGLLTPPERGPLPAALPQMGKQAVPTVAELKKSAGQAYKAVDNAGISINGDSFDHLVSDVEAKLNKLGIDHSLHPDATTVYNRLNAIRSKAAGGVGPALPTPVPFQQVMQLRELAGDAAGAQLPRDAMRGGAIQDTIDGFVNNLSHMDTVGGVNPIATTDMLNTARDLWSRAKQAEKIQGVIDDAKLNAQKGGASVEQTLRNGFASLAKNDRQMARLSPEVQKAVRDVVKGGPVANVLKLAGKLAPRGVVSAALSTGMGGAIGGVPGAVALPVIGEAARLGSTRMTSAAAQRAADIAAMGRNPLPQLPVQSVFAKPGMTANSRLPYGLALTLPQRQPQ